MTTVERNAKETRAAHPGGFFLRVLIVTETWPPEINGVALTVAGYHDGLVSRGVEVHVLRPRQGGEATVPGNEVGEYLVPGWQLPRYPQLRLGVASKRHVAVLLARIRPDVLYIATEGPLGLAALRAANVAGIPTVTGFHTNFDEFAGHYGLGMLAGMTDRYLRWFHNRASSTLVSTADMEDRLVGRGYSNIQFQPRGVDTQRFSPARRDDSLRQQWGVGPATPVLISVGRLGAEKNLLLVLDAWRAFRTANPDACLVFVGDGPFRGELERRAGNGVVFAGMLRDLELAKHYASADILLFPSETETFGNITLEGLASGLVTVAYRYAAARDVIADGVNGFAIPVGKPGTYIATVSGLTAAEYAPQSTLRAAARETADRFSLNRAHGALVEVLNGHAA